MVVDKKTLQSEVASAGLTGIRQAWTLRPMASLTPAHVVDILRRASLGDAKEYLLAAADIEEKDLHYRSVLQTRKLAAAGLPLSVSPADETPAAEKAAELVQDALERLDIPALLVGLLDALSKGYAVAEILWSTQGGRWLPQDALIREPHWFQFDRETGRHLRLYDGSPDGQELPEYKFICHAPRILAGIPIMGGLARSALWAWVFKSYALRDWAAFAELYGQPLRLGKYDASATQQDIDVLRRAVMDVGSDAAAVIPDSLKIEFQESTAKTASADLYQRLIEYLDRQVSKAVLGQTLTTDQGSSGSLAQATVHNEVRSDLLRADARSLSATLRRGLIGPIVRLNLGDAPLPHVELFVEEPEDMVALADQLSKIVPLGAKVPERWVREKWGIPEAEGDEPLLGAVSAPENLKQTEQDKDKHSRKATAAHAQETSGEDVTPISSQAERMAADAEPGWATILEHIGKLVEDAPDLPALRESLLASYADLPDGDLAEVMAMGFAAAELAGRYDVERESDV
jgi:phage gp29-like protein